MIYGSLWDAIMQWLIINNYNVGFSEEITVGYENYYNESVTVSNNDKIINVKPYNKNVILKTGQTSYTKSNNIYDLAGNCNEWILEAVQSYARVYRGVGFTSRRSSTEPTKSSASLTSRAIFYIK